MNKTTTNTEANIDVQVEETLKKTEIGEIISQNKNLILVLGAVLIVLTAGYSIMKSQKAKVHNENLNALHLFSTATLKDFKEKKIKPEAFISKLNSIGDVKTTTTFITLAIESALELSAQGNTKEGIKVLESVTDGAQLNSYAFHFAGLQLATLYENNGSTDKAIVLLEKMIPSQYHLLLSKIYFDLGRLYFTKGDLNKAKTNFEYVVNGFAKEPVADYSKLYLSEIEKRAKKN
jgi:predicted negative regulator of RcsB-dependent stress response